MGKGVLRRRLRWFLGSRLRLAGLVYSVILAFFALVFCLYPSDLLAILGTLVFTVTATLLTALKFSRDLEKSTNNQIGALGDISKNELEAAQARNQETIKAFREAIVEQVKLLSDGLDRVNQGMGSMAEALAKSAEEAQGLKRKQAEFLNQQEETRKKEETRLRQEKQVQEEKAKRLIPRVLVRIVEKAFPVLSFIQDFWLEIRNETSIKELRVIGRSFSQARNVSGIWQTWVQSEMALPKDYPGVKFGSIGVRGVHDTVEIHVEAINREDEVYLGSFTMPLRASGWIEVPLRRVR